MELFEERVTKGKKFKDFSFRKEEGKACRKCLRWKRVGRATILSIIYVAM